MVAYIPHFILIALVAAGALLFFQKAGSRRDLLAMGFASVFTAVWMLSIVMADIDVQQRTVPVFWLAITATSLLPAVFFVYLSVLLLEQYYRLDTRIERRLWMPLAIVVVALVGAEILDPEFFFRNVRLDLPSDDRLTLRPIVTLRFELGPGYWIFLAVLGYAVFEIAKRFPRVLQAMQLPEAERRTRLLLALAVMAAFWGVGFEILPTLLSTTAPSFLRLVGAALALAGAVYAMVLSRALDPHAVLRSAMFYFLRIILIAIPIGLLALGQRAWYASLGPKTALVVAVAGVMVIDYASQHLKPWLDTLALRRSYNSVEAVNRLLHELLQLRDLKDFTATVTNFLAKTLGVPDVRLWAPLPHDRDTLYDLSTNTQLQLSPEKRLALVARSVATTPADLELDPRIFPVQETLREFFYSLNAQVVLPLVDDGQLVGLVSLGIKESFDEFYAQDLDFLDRLREPLALSLSNSQLYELARAGKPVKVLTRTEFEASLERQWQRARRYNETASVALFRLADPEAFEREVGADTAVRFVMALGEKLRPTLRSLDVPAYFDADTLAIFMPQTPLAGAQIAGRRIRAWLESQEVELEGHRLRARINLGIAAREESDRHVSELLKRAEDSLADNTVPLSS